jgi:hypothetical protein
LFFEYSHAFSGLRADIAALGSAVNSLEGCIKQLREGQFHSLIVILNDLTITNKKAPGYLLRRIVVDKEIWY